MKYHVLSLDVWGNTVDGYEINQAFYIGKMISVDDSLDDNGILSSLRELSLITDDVTYRVDGNEDLMTISYYMENDCVAAPFLQLQKVRPEDRGMIYG